MINIDIPCHKNIKRVEDKQYPFFYNIKYRKIVKY